MKIILASKSPRRQELLKQIGINFEVMVCEDPEIYEENLDSYHQCESIAYHKALSIYNQTEGDRIIIGSDTIVVSDNGIVMGKPKDRDDAYHMIKLLSGTYHEVVTAYTVLVERDGIFKSHKGYEVTKVFVDELTDEEIYSWIDKGRAYDKAGAYAIQDDFGKHINRFEGDYYTIVGLPLNKIYNILKMYI